MKSNKLYKRWHERPVSSALHWILFVSISLFLTSSLVQTISQYGALNLAQVSNVISQGDGLNSEYFNGKNFDTRVLQRTDAQVSFDWGVASPAPSVNADNFSVRWSGFVEPLYSGTYTFFTNTDDGARLWVNNQQLVNDWTGHSLLENRGSVALTAGQSYPIKMEYLEMDGAAQVYLSWALSGSQAKQIIPKSQLYTSPPSVGENPPATSCPTDFQTCSDGSTVLRINPPTCNFAACPAPTGSTDVTPPTVSITSPTNGSTISGSATTISATASDNVGVAGVQFKLNGADLGSEDTTSPYSISFDTTIETNGSYTLTAVARDAQGNQITSSPVSVTVNNQAQVQLPPPPVSFAGDLVVFPNPEVAFIVGPQVKANASTTTNPWPWYDSIAITKGLQHGANFPATPWADPACDSNCFILRNYYDLGLTLYTAYYRTTGNTQTQFLNYARKVTDSWWLDWPSKGPDQWGSYQATPRGASLGGLMLRALDGRPEMWQVIERSVRSQDSIWLSRYYTSPVLGYGVRDGAFTLLHETWLAKVSPDPAVRAEFRQKALNAALLYYKRLQNSDGGWYWPIDTDYDCDQPGDPCITPDVPASQPFQVAILTEALVALHELTNDPALAQMITKAADWLYNYSYEQQYVTNPPFTNFRWRSMRYFTLLVNPSSIDSTNATNCWGATPCLNNDNGIYNNREANATTIHTFGYAYKLTGDPKYLQWGDEVFASTFGRGQGPGADKYSGLADATGKEYNQNYRSSGHYLAWRGGVNVTPIAPPAGAVPVVSITATPTTGMVGIVNPQLTWSATNNPTSCSPSDDLTGPRGTSGTNISLGILNTVKTYKFTLTCSNGNGPSAPASATVNVTAATGDITPPSIPLGLSGIAISSAQVNLSWSASTDNLGVTGYKIFRGGIQIGTSLTTSFQNTGLSANTTYVYSVSAYDTAGNNSLQSASISVVTPSGQILPPKFAVGDTVQTTTILNVRSSPGAETSLGTQPVSATGVVKCSPTSQCGPITTTSAGVTNTWWYIDYTTGYDGWSAEYFLTKYTPPQGPVRLPRPPLPNFFNASPGSVKLAWGSINYQYCEKIEIYRSTQSAVLAPTSSAKIAQLTCADTGYTDENVIGGTLYYYTLFTIDDLGVYSEPATLSFTAPVELSPAEPSPAPSPSPVSSGGGGGGGGGGGSSRTATTPDYGCSAGNLFSITTGKPCLLVSAAPLGCGLGTLFSPLTGQPCPAVSAPSYPASPAPPLLSGNFTAGNSVKVSSTLLNVRGTASATGTKLGTQAFGKTGKVVYGPIQAGSYTWYYIDFTTGIDGWVAGSFILPSTASTVVAAQSLQIGSTITATSNINVRLTPSLLGAKLGVQLLNSFGRIIAGPTAGSGYSWWKIDFNAGVDGWVAGNYIVSAIGTSPASPSQIPTGNLGSQQVISIGTIVTTTNILNIRKDPSQYSTRLGSQYSGVVGTVVEGPRLSGGYIWWKVDFKTGMDGWVVSDYLK
ncbi:MAG TPA: PA14 domain-containing protein [Candidatus Paceibacterota bacterium]